MLGKHYITEHCITYCKEKAESDVFRFYITDALRAITNNTSHLHEGGMEIPSRYSDLVAAVDDANEEKPQVTGEQVINHYKEKLRRYEKKGGKPHGLDDSNSQAGD